MESGNPRKALFLAGAAACVAYLVVGHASLFDAVHFVTGRTHQHLPIAPHTRYTSAQLPSGDFDGIVLSDNASATITIGDSASFTVDGGDANADRVTTSVEHGNLVIGGKGRPAHLNVTVPHLRTLVVAGVGNATVSGLRDSISIVVAGVGHVDASGDVDSVKLVVMGPGKFQLSRLHAKDAKIVMTGPGNVEICASDNLDAFVVGPGHVRYHGDPRVKEKVMGPGSVEKIDAST